MRRNYQENASLGADTGRRVVSPPGSRDTYASGHARRFIQVVLPAMPISPVSQVMWCRSADMDRARKAAPFSCAAAPLAGAADAALVSISGWFAGPSAPCGRVRTPVGVRVPSNGLSRVWQPRSQRRRSCAWSSSHRRRVLPHRRQLRVLPSGCAV